MHKTSCILSFSSAQSKLCCPCRCLSTTRPWRNKRSSSLGSLSHVQKSNWRKSAKATAPSKMSVWSHIAQESPRWDVKDGSCDWPIALTTKFLSIVWSFNLDSQGLAYVEFTEETHASQAVLKMDGMVIDGNKISVAISNPPRRNIMDKPGSSRPLDLMSRQVYGA